MATLERILSTLKLPDVSRDTWDVMVIGAGPAGAVAALETARRGARVLLVDRATFPRSKVCGSCLNGMALAKLEEMGLGELPQQCGAPGLQAFHVACRGRSAILPLKRGVALSRERLDGELLKAAIAAGADFVDGAQAEIEEVERDWRRISLRQASRENVVRARVIVVAAGLGCHVFAPPLADSAQTTSSSRVGAGTVLQDESDAFRVGTVYMACHRDGYVGLVRLEDGRLDVATAFDGAATKRHGGIGPLVEAILRESRMAVPAPLATAKWHGTSRLTQYRETLAGNRYLVVGDAASYVEPFTGEGIAWALTSGKGVVPFVMRYLEGDAAGARHGWSKQHRRLLGRRLRLCHVVSRLLRYPTLVASGIKLLSAAPWLGKAMVPLITESFKRSGGSHD